MEIIYPPSLLGIEGFLGCRWEKDGERSGLKPGPVGGHCGGQVMPPLGMPTSPFPVLVGVLCTLLPIQLPAHVLGK